MNNFRELNKLNVFRFFYIIQTALDDEYPYNIMEDMSAKFDENRENYKGWLVNFFDFIKKKYPKLIETKLPFLTETYINDENSCLSSMCECLWDYDNDEPSTTIDATILLFHLDDPTGPSIKENNNPCLLGSYLYADFITSENLTEVWDYLNKHFEETFDVESFEKYVVEGDEDEYVPEWEEGEMESKFKELEAFANQ